MLKLRPPSTRLRWLAVAVVIGMLGVLVTEWAAPIFAKTLNLNFQDWLLRKTTTLELPRNFVLIAIDEKSRGLSDLEPEEIAQSKPLQLMASGYPWSREVYAALADKLFKAGARIVVFDLVLLGSRPGDDAFAEVIKKYPGRVILASVVESNGSKQEPVEPHLLKASPALSAATGSLNGLANFPKGIDTKVRSVFLVASTSEASDAWKPTPGEDEYPSLSAVAAQALGAKLPDPANGRTLRFRFSLPGTMRQISMYEIFVPAFWKANFKDGAIFKDSVVLVGATAAVMHDSNPTPWGQLSGPETQLHALAAFLRGSFLGQSGRTAAILSIVAAALGIFVAALVRRNIIWFAFGLVVVAAGWLVVCAATLHFFSYFLPATPPFLTLLTCGFAVLVCDVTLERRERNRIRSKFAIYVSKDVVQEILDNHESFLQNLGGQRQEVVVLFSDLKGFTSDSEKLDPVDLVNMLNEYFGEMVDVVFKHRGTFDKFIGDALMATWGGIRKATPQEDALHALRTALEMKVRLATLNERRRARGLAPWGSGIGICQGPAIYGNIGSPERQEPTVIGDTVNLASRIEGLTRIYGLDLLVSERFAGNLPPEYGLLHVDTVRVKGRRTPERLFHPYEKAHLDPAWAAAFTAARERYVVGDFDAAGAAFAALAHEKGPHGLAHLYRQRCETLVAQPREKWEGIWDFAEK